MTDTEDDLDLDGPMKCWCGAEGKPDELFDYDCLDDTCGGSGVLYCYCGGDFCVCHHHGETECDGCEDCRPDDDFGDYDDDDD
jgi:hypothetical protein